MFNIGGAGYLNAEYFCHDDSQAVMLGTGILTMADTRVEIPNRVLELNPKTTALFPDHRIPARPERDIAASL